MKDLWKRLQRLEAAMRGRPAPPTPELEALSRVTQAFLATSGMRPRGNMVPGVFEERAAGIVERHRAGKATAEDAALLAALPADDLALAGYDAIAFVEMVHELCDGLWAPLGTPAPWPDSAAPGQA